MKKMNKKLVGCLVALGGVALSVGATFALYTKGADDVKFSIGAYKFTASSGTVNYKIGAVTTKYVNSSGTEGTDLSAPNPDYPIVDMTFPLGAEYAQDVPEQLYIPGNVSVKAKKASALSSVEVKITANVEGYADSSYWATFTDTNGYHLGDITDSKPIALETSETEIGSKNVAATVVTNPTTATSQYLHVQVDFSGLSASNFLDLAETADAYSVSVSWGDVSSDYEAAYVTGDGNGWTHGVDEYRMVPDITASTWRWMYSNLTDFSQLKVTTKKGGNTSWYGDTSGGNVTVDSAKTYTVYWGGSDNDVTVEANS